MSGSVVPNPTSPGGGGQALAELRSHLATIADLESAAAVLRWDQETQMPAGGAEGRALQLATLARVAHEMLTSDATRRLLDAADGAARGTDPSSDGAALVRMTRRDLERAEKLPADFVAEQRRAAAVATHVWQEARRTDDFAAFRPYLERMFELARREAGYIGYSEHPYDALVDRYDPGITARELEGLFGRLLAVIVPLVRAVAPRAAAVPEDILDADFDEGAQRAFALEMVQAFGYETRRGRLDLSAHPFSTKFHRDDVRITTRHGRRLSAVFGTFHESGHAMYSQGTDPALERSPLSDGAGNGIHESQSRMWENLVGRSRPFWEYALPRLRRAFPEQLRDAGPEDVYRAVNRVEPGLIRVSADEVTYNLHIVLRFELEKSLLTGDLSARDLPEAWRGRMQRYLGVTPPSDTDGVLQDIHWSIGLVGSFSSYTLGNVVSVQLFEAARRAHPHLADDIRAGRFATLYGWMREHVYAHGRKFLPAELLARATGGPLTPEPYLRYLSQKYGDLYGLEAASR
ncbi:MAG TPA: carboxypeptidase M32 [bacterium]|nr:carboxypeptidase M32 [bacterium]